MKRIKIDIFFSLKSMEAKRIQLKLITDESNYKNQERGGRKAEGGTYVNKPLTGRFGPVLFLYS